MENAEDELEEDSDYEGSIDSPDSDSEAEVDMSRALHQSTANILAEGERRPCPTPASQRL